MPEDEFSLYDLKVEVADGGSGRPFVCKHQRGDVFELRGSALSIPPGKTFGLYAMLAVLPFLPAKQRPTAGADWMSTDAEIACTDPHCGAVFRITRLGLKTYRHADHSKVPLAPPSA